MTSTPTMARRRASWMWMLASGLVITAASCSGTRAAAPETTATAATSGATTEAPTTTAAKTTTSRASTTSTTKAPTTTRPAPRRRPVEREPARMPLTGQPLKFGQKAPDRPAVVVKIDNVGAARPQTGLNQADVVFEEIVEGRATRFAAVFHSQGANPVGPIRSGRTQDVDLLSGLNHPLFTWSGGNPGVTDAINNSGFISVNQVAGGGGFFRTDRPAPHNLYNNTDAIWAQATPEAGRPMPLFRYVMPGHHPAGKLRSWMNVRMGTNEVRWEYSPQCDCYLRSQGGAPHELTDGQATADNVVVLITGYRPSPVDARSPEAITVGQGDAFVMSNGRLQAGRWQRKVNTDPVRLFTKKRTLMEIAPGRTWVELADAADHTVDAG
jgi:hypothetical protein